ncbi:MAG: hypothetical protein AB7O66_21370 [Limisphaerales bacterium]
MKSRAWFLGPLWRGLRAAGVFASVVAVSGCAETREGARYRDQEREVWRVTAVESRRDQLDDPSPWDRERMEQEARWHDQFRRD